MSATPSSEEWRWTDELGVQRRVSAEELREALSTGVLAGSTLVWRRGMAAWLPAQELPEFFMIILSARNDGEGDTITEATLTEPGREIREIMEAAVPAPEVVRQAAAAPAPRIATRDGKAPMRQPMQTLVGLEGKEGEAPRAGASTPPIVVPSAGGAPEPGVARAITRPPKFGAPDEGRGGAGAAAAVIPRAPRVPGLRAEAPQERPAPAAPRRPTIGMPPRKPAAGGAEGAPAVARDQENRPGSSQGSSSQGSSVAEALTRVAEAPAQARPTTQRASVPPPPRPVGRNLPPPPRLPDGEAATPVQRRSTPPPAAVQPVAPTQRRSTPPPAAVQPVTSTQRRSTPPPAAVQPAAPTQRRSVPPPPVAVRPPTLPLKTPEPSRAAEEQQASVEPATPTPLAGEVPPIRRGSGESQTLASPLMPDAGNAAPQAAPLVAVAPAPASAAAAAATTAAAAAAAAAATAAAAANGAARAPAVTPPPAALRVPAITPAITSAVSPAITAPVITGLPTVGELGPESWSDAMRSGGSVLRAHVRVPVSSLVNAGGALILLAVLSFFAGRCSVGSRERPETARAAIGGVVARSRAAAPGPPRPCYVARQPRRWAPLVAKSVPFDVAATGPGALAVGYARTPTEAVGLEVDLAKNAVTESFAREESGPIARVFPTPGGAEKFAVPLEAQGAIRSAVHVPGKSPLVVGLADGGLVAAERADGATTPLWPASGGEPDALRVAAAGAQGWALGFRRDGAVWGGWIGAGRAPMGQPSQIAGSGGAIGKPSLGWNGREVAVVFADRASSGRWEIRLGRAPFGQVPTTTEVLPLPEGGPGGDAFAPDIAGLDDGRWLLVWTEGPPGSRAMRAQTLAPDLSPVGDPIALSPPAGNFGQGMLGVAGGYVGAVFLSKPAATYELWGVVLQCG